MSCFRPLQAVRVLSSLDHPIQLISRTDASTRFLGNPNLLQLPCGKCVGCRLDYSRNWAVRCVHESQLHEYNSFVTLTYNDHYNDLNGGSLNYRDVQLFLKRLRKQVSLQMSRNGNSEFSFLSSYDSNVRFYMCGEYGDKSFRPHFHILFFNLDFSDQVLHSVRNGFKLFTSETLSSFWRDPVTKESMGYAVIGTVTFQSCAYVSRYVVKKALDGDRPLYFNKDTGEFLSLEKTNMSRRPGIAYDWFMRYRHSTYPHDEIVMPNGFKCKPPRYYDLQLEKIDPLLLESVKQTRVDYASSPLLLANNTVDRLIVREKIQLKKLDLLPRSL